MATVLTLLSDADLIHMFLLATSQKDWEKAQRFAFELRRRREAIELARVRKEMK